MNNRQVVEVGIFKDIFSDPPIATGKPEELIIEKIEKTATKETLLVA